MLKKQYNQAKIKSIISDHYVQQHGVNNEIFSINMSKKSNHNQSSIVLSAVNEINNDPFSCGSLNELIALTQDSKDSKTKKGPGYNRSDFLYPNLDETLPKVQQDQGLKGIKNTVVDAFKHQKDSLRMIVNRLVSVERTTMNVSSQNSEMLNRLGSRMDQILDFVQYRENAHQREEKTMLEKIQDLE